MNATTDPLVRDWLRTVERGLAPLPRHRRGEVLGDLREHVEGALAGASSEADVRDVLARLGDPGEVAAAARAEEGLGPVRSRPWLEWAGLALISVGSLVPFLGWTAGIVLVWASDVWRTWEKVLASVLYPLGWTGALWTFQFLQAGGETCVGNTCTESWVSNPFLNAWLVVAIVGPVVTTFVLGRTLRWHREASAL